MTQHELDTAVSRASGEDIREIRRRGFSLADPLDTNFDPEPDNIPAQVLDWDDIDPQGHQPAPATLLEFLGH